MSKKYQINLYMNRPQSSSSSQRKNNVTKRAVNLVFKPEADIKAIQNIMDNFRDLVKQKEWRVLFQEYKKKNIKKIFDEVTIVLVECLTFHFCKHGHLVKDISNISFPRLTMLDLSGNKIASLEPFQTCNLPVLERLYLRQNHITSVRSLRKCNFKLKQLGLQENNIICFDDIWGSLDLTSLQMLHIYSNKAITTMSIAKSQMNFKQVKRYSGYNGNNINLEKLYRSFRQIGIGQQVLHI